MIHAFSTQPRHLPVTNPYCECLPLHTHTCMEFIDITQSVSSIVDRSSIETGLVNIQTRHTTSAVLVNEHEPLLLNDLSETLERLAPQNRDYQHDDLSIRTVNLVPNEPENGHSHCKALFLSPSVLLNIYDGQLQLGTWQRIFFLELDRARQRSVSVMVMGQ